MNTTQGEFEKVKRITLRGAGMYNTQKSAKIRQKNVVCPRNDSRSPLFVTLREGMANHSIKEALVPALDAAHKAFLDGDRFVLFDVIIVCATFQAVIPSWAVDALLDIGEGIGAGRLKDMNDAFGPARTRVNSRHRQTRLRKVEGSVIAMLLTVRGEGLPLSAEYAFDEATKRLVLQGVHVNRRDVEDIYRIPRVKGLISSWPQGKVWDGGVVSGGILLRDLKLSGRPLWGSKTQVDPS